MVLMINPIRIVECLVLSWKVLEIISKLRATLSAIGLCEICIIQVSHVDISQLYVENEVGVNCRAAEISSTEI